MDNGRNRGKFSEGGRMGFEPVENVGLAAKESAQEILKIFNQVHEPRVVHSPSQASTQWVAQGYLSYRSAELCMGGCGRSDARPSQICQPLLASRRGHILQVLLQHYTSVGGQLNADSSLQRTSLRCT